MGKEKEKEKEQEQNEKKQQQSRRRMRSKEQEEKMEMEMQINFQAQKDYNSPNQCLSVEAQISKQCPDPLSIPGPQGFGSVNDLELVPTAQGGDFEGERELEGRTGGDQQPQSGEHIVNIPGQLTTDPEAAGESLFSERMSNYSEPMSNYSEPMSNYSGRTGGDQQPQSGEHIMGIPEQQTTDPEAAGESLFSERMSNYSEPMSNYSGWLSFLENFILGPNQGNQIWRLRLLSGISLYIATVVCFLFYLGDLPQAQAQAPYHYQMVMLITTVGAPIVVAMIGLFVSFWFPNRQNWITGSSVANFIMLCGQAIYWAQKWGTGY